MTHPNYLGFYRKRWALTKDELANLLGYRARHAVGRTERLERNPTLKLALGLEVVFGVSPSQIFPGLYGEIEEQVMHRAAALDKAIRGKTDDASVKKRELLIAMVERSAKRPQV